MDNSEYSYQVIISGAGPVGLFLGCCLQWQGIPFLIIEKRKQRISHSRSLGIHPVSMELFQKLDLAKAFLESGIKIKKGHAFSDSGKIGSISFESCPKPFNFILSLPQFKTEEILESRLLNLESDALLRGFEVTNIQEQTDHVSITAKDTDTGEERSFRCAFLVGCDGKDSSVRQQADITFEGSAYPDTYVMGDFADNTSFGSEAVIFLSKDGLIESFPMSADRRRWVVKTDAYVKDISRVDIESIVADRIGHDLSGVDNSMLSSFGVQKLMADPIARGRIALCGDAAHIVSPIGGQGMNLGWLDAWDLSKVLAKCLKSEELKHREHLEAYANRRESITKNAVKRSELNMRLGRKSRLPAFRNALVWLMLRTPLNQLMAKLFTMRILDNRFI